MRAKPRIPTVVVALITFAFALALPRVSPASAQRKKARTHRASEAAPAAPATPAGPSAEAKEQARAAYGRGQAAFAAGQFEVSKTAFEEAFAAVPNPIVLLSIAESQVKLDQVVDAIATLQHYLELRSDAPDRADIEAKLKALSAMPARLAVTSEPSGAAIDVDGLPTQRTTPGQVELTPGEHTLEYSLRGYQGGSETITVQPGGKLERHYALTPLSTEPALLQASAGAGMVEEEPGEAPVASSEPASKSSAMPTTALWVTAGVGAAGLVAGTVFGFLAVKEHSNFNDHPSEATANRGERMALFADVGFGVGIMAIATAAVLYLTADDSSASTDTAKLELTPQLAPTAVAASARLRF